MGSRPLRVALTGGIATGKSHVLRAIAARGVPTIDADVIAREVVAAGTPALQAISRRFGPAVLDAQGALDRRRLADIVFSDADARLDLERIIHPEVYRGINDWFDRIGRDGAALGVADIPLLFETGHAGDFDRVVVTHCASDVQIARIVARDGLSEAAARRRVAAQAPLDEKAARADFVIRTDGTLQETEQQVEKVLEALRSSAEGGLRSAE